MSEKESHPFIEWFRNTTPYINTHRGHTFVLMISGETVAHANFPRIIQDIALLNSLGVRLVLIHGSRPQIDARLNAAGITPSYHNEVRITDSKTLSAAQEAAGSVRVQIEAQLSTIAHRTSFSQQHKLRVVGGNFVTAKPLGVIDGVDFCHTGTVRRVDDASITHFLNDGAIVLISHLGYSPSGEVFNLSVEEVACEVATVLKADKLILLGTNAGWLADQILIRELTTAEANPLLAHATNSEQKRLLNAATHACIKGVARSHIISYQQDGALLEELFTHDGSGTLITQENYEQTRTAILDDVDGIIELIRPLEEADILVPRSRERIEDEINYFTVCERDGLIIGCAALYPLPDKLSGEVACVAVHPHYRNHHRGDHLLRFLEKSAATSGMKQLFVLTTQTAHWFTERGFQSSSVDELPLERQTLYNFQRNSKVFKKNI
jgi:amino-acid N-acetyltransferase